MLSEGNDKGAWLNIPVTTRTDLPEGWVFIEAGDGNLVPVLAVKPDEEGGGRVSG